MASANTSANPETVKILDSAAKLATPELEKLAKQIVHLVAIRREQTASAREKSLLEKIKKPLLSLEQQKRYKALQKMRQGNTLNSEEHQELLGLIHLKEQHGANRLENMIELAKLRAVTFDELLDQLGMKAPFPENA